MGQIVKALAFSLVLSVLAVSPLFAAEVLVPPAIAAKNVVVPSHTLVRVRVQDDERAFVLRESLDVVDYDEWYKNGSKQGIIWTGPPGKYVLVVVPDKSDDLRFTQVTISNEVDPTPTPPTPPTPPPDPDVDRPDGFAGEVFDQAIKIKKPADCASISLNYLAVSSKIGAGGIKTTQAAINEITRLNESLKLGTEWVPFGTWLRGQLNERAQVIGSAQKFMADVSVGLDAASKVKK